MDSDDKISKDLEKVFVAGDAWLRKYGHVEHNMTHNNIVLNLRMLPKVQNVEYWWDPNNKKIDVVLLVRFWDALFMNKSKLLDSAIEVVEEYLHGWTVTARIARYKPEK